MPPKKSFIQDLDNPAMQFITQPVKEEPTATQAIPSSTENVPDGYKLNPLYIEKKTKRVQLLMQPSVFEQVKERAKAEGCSVNDYIHRLLEKAVKGE